MTTRVYHPTGNAWQDVPDEKVDEWKSAGWRKTKPGHVDDSDAPAVGEHPGTPETVDITGDATDVPLIDNTSSTNPAPQ